MVANKLRELREGKGFTLRELGKEVDMNASVLGNYERGDRQPKVEVWQQLAEYFDVSVSYIMGIKDDEQKYSNEITIEKLEYDRLLDIEKKYDAIRKLVEE